MLNAQRTNVKITDFGMAHRMQNILQPESQTPTVGTVYYRAPEVLMNNCHHGPAIDVWSIGCVFYEMAVQEVLFNSTSEFRVLTLIVQ